ncbi:MAG: tautomerase family protein [Anaerolineae bacterium]|nr:tautomerase family protein [Anaerolineae bacterium]MCB1723395.1 tautomerase family protein [Gammaproteobacteria bacterium]MCP5299964.1 tautomerase family protein [Chromatiaceae bacterium]
MPYLYVRIAGDADPVLAERVAADLLAITGSVLGKRKEVTSISIDFVPATTWFVGGSRVADDAPSTFYLNIKITEGTNTKDQKAAYVDKVFPAMQALIGPLARASYIVIDDVRADAWGFEGKTQEQRYITARTL